MKVPDDLVQAALEAAGRAGGMAEPRERARYTRALEAVLPKVRERVATRLVVRNLHDCIPLREVLAAFDHAFREEDRGELNASYGEIDAEMAFPPDDAEARQ